MVFSFDILGSVVLDIDTNRLDATFLDDLGNIQDYFTMTKGSVVADFSASPLGGVPPLTVDFTDESQGNITSWSWDFGDGSTSTSQDPSHTYTTVKISSVV